MFKEAAENSDRIALIANENIIKEKANSKVNENLRLYYMQILIKFIRDINLLKDNDKHLTQFEKINEFSERV